MPTVRRDTRTCVSESAEPLEHQLPGTEPERGPCQGQKRLVQELTPVAVMPFLYRKL